MRLTHRRTLVLSAAAALALAAPAVAAAHGSGHDDHGNGMRGVKRIVVIYEENHSFDNLYGGWEGVNGRRHADRRAHHAGQPGRRAVHVPAAGRREPDDAAAGGDLHGHDDPDKRSRATSATPRSRSMCPSASR